MREVHPPRERWNYSRQYLPDSPLRYLPAVAPLDRQFVRPQGLGTRGLVGAHLIVVIESTLTSTVATSAFSADHRDETDQVPSAPPRPCPPALGG